MVVGGNFGTRVWEEPDRDIGVSISYTREPGSKDAKLSVIGRGDALINAMAGMVANFAINAGGEARVNIDPVRIVAEILGRALNKIADEKEKQAKEEGK